MTDIDKLKKLLTEFGVEFEESERNKLIYIDCEEGAEKVNGYAFFYTCFEFDQNGKFIVMGAWE